MKICQGIIQLFFGNITRPNKSLSVKGILIKSFLIFIFLSSISNIARASNVVINFGREANINGGGIMSIGEDSNGVMFFGSTNSVVIFDGINWKTLETNGMGEIWSVKYDSIHNRIYIGGTGAAGFIEKDKKSGFKFNHLFSASDNNFDFKEIWQIERLADSIIFVIDHGLISLKNGKFRHQKTNESSYIYKANNFNYWSVRDQGLYTDEKGTFNKIWDQQECEGEVVYSVFPISRDENLIIFPSKGIFNHNLKTNSISKIENPLSELINEKWFYHGVKIKDTLLALITWEEGIIISKPNGEILAEYDVKNALLTNELYQLHYSQNGLLWFCHLYGISLIDINRLLKDNVEENSQLHYDILNVKIGDDSIFYAISNDSLFIDDENTNLEILLTANGAIPGQALSFKYQLENFDEAPCTSASPEITYSNLPNGDYEFKLFDFNSNRVQDSVKIRVYEPWYSFFTAELFFYLLSILVLIIIGIAVIVRSQNKQERLRQIVAKKTRQIREQNQKLQKANLNLTSLNDELDTFLYRSSHDLVSPVKSIRGLIQLIKMSDQDKDKYIELMDDRINHLEKILTEINKYLKSTGMNAESENINLYELVNEIWSEMEFIPDAELISFENQLDENLIIRSKIDHIRMIFRNMISNALKYHDLRKDQPFIRVCLEKDDAPGHPEGGTKVNFVIEDNGQGIRGELQSKVFEMFYRANESSTGSGLGLFLVNKMIKQINGEISFSSEFKKGTKFRLSFSNKIITNEVPAEVAMKSE